MKTVPNKWVLIEIWRGGKSLHKVFATWSGGYLDGDSWRLNSGISKTEFHEDHFVFQGYSGSNYKCYKNSYGVAGSSNYGVLDGLLKKLNDMKGVTASILEEGEVYDHMKISS